MSDRLLPTFALVVAAGIFLAYIAPTWSGSLASMRAAIAFDDHALSAATTYTTQQNELAAARNAIDPSDLARLTTLLPDSVDNVGLILDLDALAARNGLSLSNIDVVSNTTTSTKTTGLSVSTGAGTSPVGSVDLSLSAVGTYAALQAFLEGIEKSQRLLDIKDLVVKGSDTGVYTYQMKITLYWLR